MALPNRRHRYSGVRTSLGRVARGREANVVPGKVGIVRVSSHSLPKAVAGAVAGMIRAGEAVELQAVGAGAVNQAVKAIAVARVFLAEEGVDLVSMPRFLQVAIDGEDRMAIGISVERR